MPRALLRDLNAALSCMLCGGYLVNAATLVDCLHSFCKVCIVRYLDTSKLCPICDVPVHKSRPLSCLRVDKTLQDIVYKVVPGLYQREMKQRQEFYDQHPDAASKVSCLEDRGVVEASSRLIFSPQDTVSVSLEYFTGTTQDRESEDDGKECAADAADDGGNDDRQGPRRFLNCPAAFTVNHLQKFLRTKYALGPSLKIDILHMNDVLCEGYSLMDVAYIYAWKRDSPLRLAFRVYSQPAKRPASTDTAGAQADVDERHCDGNPTGQQQQQCPREEATAPGRPVPEESSEGVEEGVAQSLASPEPDAAGPPATLVPRDMHPPDGAAGAVTPPVVPAAETRLPETRDASMAAETPAAFGSAQMAETVLSSFPQQEQRQKASEPPAESLPALSKITISTLDRSSNKITIQTKEVPPTVAQAMSPPRSPQSKKSRRKEQRNAERTLQYARHQRRSPDSQGRPWSRSPERPEGATTAKNRKLDGADFAGVDGAQGRGEARPASPGKLLLECASLPEPAKRSQSPTGKGSGACSSGLPASPPQAHPQTPKTPPATPLASSPTKGEEDTRPLDLSVSHRGLPAPAPVRRPVGRPPLVLPTACPPGTAKGPASPSPYRKAAVASPAVSLYQKPAVAVNQAATSSPLSQQHHHHHNHHRSGSRGFLKGANLTCINPDPDAFHPRIVIKNLQTRASCVRFNKM
ncbi:polycomb group protein Psc-like [Ixodes scapularis]|uniref:polycomb group protein Psc-like n=1 Tax=Ixodes scapularis TaxID=6945 RepID=UPI001A9ED142|nr:polycomb group protein Psc-like [Ixodes scapularis]